MYVARLIVVFVLILVIAGFYSPELRGEVSQSWRDVRPGVIEFMDGLYATIRNFGAGNEPEDGVDKHAPGVNFEEVITRDPGVFSIL